MHSDDVSGDGNEEAKPVPDWVTQLEAQSQRADRWLERRALSTSFFDDVLEQEPSDWGFILKMTAAAEAVLSDIILSSLESDDLLKYKSSKGIIEPDPVNSHAEHTKINHRSPLGPKIHLLESRGLLPPNFIAFLRALNKLRTEYAHDVSSIPLGLHDILSRLPPGESSDIIDATFNFYLDIDARKEELETIIAHNPSQRRARNKYSRTEYLPKVDTDSIQQMLEKGKISGWPSEQLTFLMLKGSIWNGVKMLASIAVAIHDYDASQLE